MTFHVAVVNIYHYSQYGWRCWRCWRCWSWTHGLRRGRFERKDLELLTCPLVRYIPPVCYRKSVSVILPAMMASSNSRARSQTHLPPAGIRQLLRRLADLTAGKRNLVFRVVTEPNLAVLVAADSGAAAASLVGRRCTAHHGTAAAILQICQEKVVVSSKRQGGKGGLGISSIQLIPSCALVFCVHFP